MKKVLLFVAALLLFVGQAKADFTLGGGYEYSTLVNKASGIVAKEACNGAYVNARIGIHVVAGFSIDPELEFSWAGKKTEGEIIDGKTYTEGRYDYYGFTLPILFNYGFKCSDNFTLNIFAGPFAECGVSCKTTFKGGDVAYEMNWYDKNTLGGLAYLNRWNYGLKAGLGFDIAKHLRLSFSHQFGFGNLIGSDVVTIGDTVMRRSIGQAGIAFLF